VALVRRPGVDQLVQRAPVAEVGLERHPGSSRTRATRRPTSGHSNRPAGPAGRR
jgi:hypothetical protein